MLKGTIFDIQRVSTHDGPGIRTTIFLKGCALNCFWCQNPEGISRKPDILWVKNKCIGCLTCKKTCPENAIIAGPKKITIDRLLCNFCGICTTKCPSGAMQLISREYTVNELVKEVLKDKIYFRQSSGGITASGGEPLDQYHYVTEFFKKIKKESINTALDTCGFASREAFDSILPYCDLLLYDLKILDNKKHRKYTGQSNELILENLLYVADYIRKKKRPRLWIRTPLIPGSTATIENITSISRYIKDNIYDVVKRWELCAFNNICGQKYIKLDMDWKYNDFGLLSDKFTHNILRKALGSALGERKVYVTGFTSSK